MKVTVLALVGVLLVALLLIGGWFVSERNRIQGETQAFVEEAEARRIVSVTFEVDVPDTTPADQIVYVSGSHPNLGAWQAAGLPLRRGEDGRYHGQAELLSGIEHGYKITRGTWGTVEQAADQADLPNRMFVAEGDTTLTAEVARWIDNGQSVPGRITLSGDVRVLAKVPSDHLELPRDLVVYLPPGYGDAPDARYPVLYLDDGQNLFNEQTSYAGVEWGLDETLEQLIADGTVPPMIVVGLYNTEDRDAEYTPGDGLTAYGRAVVEDFKPMIDRIYRTQPGPESTAIGGSSLGATAALGVAADHPDVFGRVIALSPRLSFDDGPAAEVFGDRLAALAGRPIYLDMGDAPTDNYPADADPVDDAEAFVAALRSAGAEVDYRVVTGGGHQERDWAKRVGEILTSIYAP
ncbi:MAG: alpha/beta hydrolase-fold protein [Planctomycetota bacterium]